MLTEQAIRDGLAACEADGYTVGPHDAIVEYILKAASGEESEGEVMHAGYRLVRRTGAEMNRRGRARHYTGWEIVDPETGEVVQSLHPNGDGGVPLGMVKSMAETERKIANLKAARA